MIFIPLGKLQEKKTNKNVQNDLDIIFSKVEHFSRVRFTKQQGMNSNIAGITIPWLKEKCFEMLYEPYQYSRKISLRKPN